MGLRRGGAWLGVSLLVGCAAPPLEDAGVDSVLDASVVDAGEPRDPGFDIPPSEWIDGGFGDAWGCFGRNLDRFIARFETRDGAQPWCAAVLFKRQDAGFTPLFPEFGSPEGFQISDARWALTCGGLELPNGELGHAFTRPVHDLFGSMSLTAFVGARPQQYEIDGGIRVAYRVYRFSQLAGIGGTCQGP